ncbi:hypothetical protein EEL32_25505 [Brevibacillus laterosporus]|nr:hypothetical protein [Brevibacillus laterosporus]TPG74016.1 hypothetical protein EEL32_25505 [Brevibacillus laterosporus]
MGTSIPNRANEIMSTKSSPMTAYTLSPEELAAERIRLALVSKGQTIAKGKKPIEVLTRKQVQGRRDSGKIPSSRKKLS